MQLKHHEIVEVEISKQDLRTTLDWMDYVPEHEFTKQERLRICRALDRCREVLQPITEKYMS